MMLVVVMVVLEIGVAVVVVMRHCRGKVHAFHCIQVLWVSFIIKGFTMYCIGPGCLPNTNSNLGVSRIHERTHIYPGGRSGFPYCTQRHPQHYTKACPLEYNLPCKNKCQGECEKRPPAGHRSKLSINPSLESVPLTADPFYPQTPTAFDHILGNRCPREAAYRLTH